MLSCPAARCWIMTKTKPVLDFSCSRSDVIASKPPAEAPIPTMGPLCLERAFLSDSAGFFFLVFGNFVAPAEH